MSATHAIGLDLSDLASLTSAIDTATEIASRMSEELGREAVRSYAGNPDGRRASAQARLAAANLHSVIAQLRDIRGRL